MSSNNKPVQAYPESVASDLSPVETQQSHELHASLTAESHSVRLNPDFSGEHPTYTVTFNKSTLTLTASEKAGESEYVVCSKSSTWHIIHSGDGQHSLMRLIGSQDGIEEKSTAKRIDSAIGKCFYEGPICVDNPDLILDSNHASAEDVYTSEGESSHPGYMYDTKCDGHCTIRVLGEDLPSVRPPIKGIIAVTSTVDGLPDTEGEQGTELEEDGAPEMQRMCVGRQGRQFADDDDTDDEMTLRRESIQSYINSIDLTSTNADIMPTDYSTTGSHLKHALWATLTADTVRFIRHQDGDHTMTLSNSRIALFEPLTGKPPDGTDYTVKSESTTWSIVTEPDRRRTLIRLVGSSDHLLEESTSKRLDIAIGKCFRESPLAAGPVKVESNHATREQGLPLGRYDLHRDYTYDTESRTHCTIIVPGFFEPNNIPKDETPWYSGLSGEIEITYSRDPGSEDHDHTVEEGDDNEAEEEGTEDEGGLIEEGRDDGPKEADSVEGEMLGSHPVTAE